ncbi:unnamed protein product [Linum tenue]|uniref:Auxin response factor n=1 Tax=Linum tenue TaxID=586396 RepID=A0AAV0MNA4_9ROSI|nr:unnamed protein product [Linum tenue]
MPPSLPSVELPPPPPPPPRTVDRRIWQSCAGSFVQIPSVNSRVYYFPQGHLEQSSSSSSSPSPFPPSISSLVLSRPMILCRISSVQFLADPVTDEVYAKLHLLPLDHPSSCSSSLGAPLPLFQHPEEDRIMAYAKVLTASDANNGGGFSVPRFCADSIFPPLNYEADPPVQTLTVTDVHGTRWDFRHIYRGTPRRHLLTTGWSKFVNNKKLIAGDSVIFMRSAQGEMFIGVRRSARFSNAANFARWREHFGTGEEAKVKLKEDGGARTSARGMLTHEAVAEATELAARGLPFEAVYYPRSWSFSDFVVSADVVEAALGMFWSAGTRVKMAVESEDLSRATWFQGTVASAVVPGCGPWQGSPWRMLQCLGILWSAPEMLLREIKWDEPEVLQSAQRISPWQVTFVSTNSSFQSGIPAPKKLRYPDKSELLMDDGEGDLRFPMSGLANSTMGPPLLNFNNFPAGMQGARQNDTFPTFGLSNCVTENSGLQISGATTSFTNVMMPKVGSLSTELNIGSSQSDNLSPDSHSSMQSFGTEILGNQGCTSANCGTISSFQLFGQIIHFNQPVERSSDDVSCMEDQNAEDCTKDGQSVNHLLDLSLASSYTELLSRIDVQYQRSGAVDAYERVIV